MSPVQTLIYWRAGEIRTPDPLVRSATIENKALILLINSAWRLLHLAPPSTTEHNETRKSPATTWLVQRVATA